MKIRLIHISNLIIFVLLQIGHLGNSPLPNIDLYKLNPSLQAVMIQSGINIQNAPAQGIPQKAYLDEYGEERYGVIIKTDDARMLQNSGIHLNSVFGEIATAMATPEEILFLAGRKEVKYVDIPSISVNKMNNSLPEMGASLVHAGFINNTPYRGEGAIVLIYDSGIDWSHPAFRDPNDPTKSRILSIWDQTLTPSGGESQPSGFNYGVEYTKPQIEDELDGSPANFVRTTNSDGHGTHVAGIAAGGGEKFSGVAPDADIIIVKGGDGSFPENYIIDGISYAAAKSTAFGKPIVVNLSLGGQNGPHDGSRAYEQIIDSFNSQPGQVAIVAAGNDGNELIHISGSLQTSGSVTFQFNVPAGYVPNAGSSNDEFLFSLWYDENTTVSAKITSPNAISFTANNNQSGSPPNQTDGFIYLENSRIDESKQNILVYVSDQSANNPPASGTWTLELSGASAAVTYDGWLAQRGVGEDNVSLLNANALKTISMPGTAEKAVTVGAYVTKNSWPAVDGRQYQYTDDDAVGEIADFSSVGPTRDGRVKPDISAPGKGIVAALSGDSDEADVIVHPDSAYVLSQGTSMSTPHVTGAAAVLLGIDASLTADQIRALFNDTAGSDTFTGSLPNNTWGNGKLSLLNAVIKKVNYADGSEKNLMEYYNNNSGPYYVFDQTDKMAVRFTPSNSGQITGLYLTLLISHPDINPVISGSGFLNCAIHTDAGGVPGSQLGSMVAMPLKNLDPGTKNYINMLTSNVSVTVGNNYHAVIWLSDPANSIKILFDDGTLEQVNNPSLVYVGNTWYTFKDAFSNTPYNFLLGIETTTLFNPNAIDQDFDRVAYDFSLFQNYPNPFNPSTTIRYSLRQPGDVNLTIYDALGRKVITLMDGYQEGGIHEVSWQATNQRGNKVTSGIYFYHLKSADGVKTKKMILLK